VQAAFSVVFPRHPDTNRCEHKGVHLSKEYICCKENISPILHVLRFTFSAVAARPTVFRVKSY
jgi:hypothetical protein